MRYRPEIDGLRAVAIVPVILFHAGIDFFEGGFVGVDVFFVISGYLITSIILAELKEKRFSFSKFYERRARRIFPALFFVMAISVPFAVFLFEPVELMGFWKSFVSATLFASNFFFWTDTGYFGGVAELKPLLHTWSLAVEEQYYLLFPLFMVFAWHLRLQAIVVFLAVIFCISLAAAQWGAIYKPTAAFYLLPTRGWEILAGAFSAIWLSSHAIRSSNVLGGVGLSLIVISILTFDGSFGFPGLYATVPVLGTVLIILAATPVTLVGRLLSSTTIVWMGNISFSLYLWHQPILAFLRHEFGYSLRVIIVIFAVVLTFVLSWITWKYVERPFRDRSFLNGWSIGLLSVLLIGLFVTIGGIGIFNHGATYWISSNQRDMLASAIPSPKRGDCHTGGAQYLKPQDACVYNGKPATWAIFGDSHAVELAYGFGEVLKPSQIGVAHFSYSGCKPAWHNDNEPKSCKNWTEEVVEYIAKHQTIQNVVISYRLNEALFGSHLGVWPKIPNSTDEVTRGKRWTALLGTINRFERSGKNVILVLQAPETPMDVQNLIVGTPVEGDAVKGVSADWWERRSDFVRSSLSQLPDDVTVFDPASVFCADESCYAVKSGTALYFDNNHMSVEGAQLIATEIIRQLQ
jgi:peptidoglycan/LPS O-acetylase OafA/YrhL